MRILPIALVLATAVACDGTGAPPTATPPTNTPPAPKPAEGTPALPAGEPERIAVTHVLVSFKGAIPDPQVTRSKEEAETLAKELFARIKGGEDFEPIRKRFSDDRGGSDEYGMANHGVTPQGQERPRRGMVAAFGDVGFTLKVGEVGLAPYDPQKSPYGWHIVKRTK